jgi:hypothetical protein
MTKLGSLAFTGLVLILVAVLGAIGSTFLHWYGSGSYGQSLWQFTPRSDVGLALVGVATATLALVALTTGQRWAATLAAVGAGVVSGYVIPYPLDLQSGNEAKIGVYMAGGFGVFLLVGAALTAIGAVAHPSPRPLPVEGAMPQAQPQPQAQLIPPRAPAPPVAAAATPAAGWFPDPSGSGRQRYWDGERWTEHLHP